MSATEQTSAEPSCNCGRCHGCGRPLAIDNDGAVCGNGNCRRSSCDIAADRSSPYYGPCLHPAYETPAQSLEDKVAILERTLKLVSRSRDQLVYQVSVVTKERDQARAALREFEEADTCPIPKLGVAHDTPEGKRFAELAASWAGIDDEAAQGNA